jgi:hypothetical protein
MTEAELKQLAVDVVDGKVFGSWMIPEDDKRLLAVIFLPLAFKQAGEKLPEDVWCMYEYIDKASRHKVKDYPTFMTCKYLTGADCAILNPAILAYHEFKTKFLAPTDVSLPDAVAQPDAGAVLGPSQGVVGDEEPVA